jgi:hypothetical protein
LVNANVGDSEIHLFSSFTSSNSASSGEPLLASPRSPSLTTTPHSNLVRLPVELSYRHIASDAEEKARMEAAGAQTEILSISGQVCVL